MGEEESSGWREDREEEGREEGIRWVGGLALAASIQAEGPSDLIWGLQLGSEASG